MVQYSPPQERRKARLKRLEQLEQRAERVMDGSLVETQDRIRDLAVLLRDCIAELREIVVDEVGEDG